jgi:VWFA-related protein
MHAGIYSCRLAMLFACLMGGSAMLCAQQPAGVHKENGVYTLHEGTHLVLLDVTVADKQGQPVAGLTKDDFKLLEDGQPQTIKFFEEHAPVDPAEIARQKAAALAGQPNTFTNYEPFAGRPITVLLLNRLFPFSPGPEEMLEVVQTAPPDTPFAVYVLGPELQLVQPVTTDRALLAVKINGLERLKTPSIGAEKPTDPDTKTRMPVDDVIAARRGFMTAAMQQLAAAFKDTPGRKALFAFTGAFQCSTVLSTGGAGVPACPEYGHFGHDREFLCGLEDTLEQGRIWIYRYYPSRARYGGVGYGFGCGSTGAGVRDLSHYYTLYYTPTNGDWNGKYRATAVEVANKGLHLSYRKGYYATSENTKAHYSTAPVPADSGGAASSGPTITATPVAAGHADSASLGATAAAAAPNPAQQILHRHQEEVVAAKPAPNPASSVFTVQVIPASATNAPDKGKQQYRRLTLQFTMPASEFKVVQSDSGQYVARLEISANGYADGVSQETYASQVVANFDGPADPRIANSTITAKLTVNILEHGRSRWLDVSVRDVATGQFGSLIIPMGQVTITATQ